MKGFMKKRHFASIVFFSLLLAVTGTAVAWDKAIQSKFDSANQSYRDARYEEAKGLYEELAKAFPEMPSVFYNLGNTYFRLGKMGRAVLAYETAQELDPRNSDIRSNLKYVKSLLEYKMEDKRNWYLRAEEQAVHFFTEQELQITFLACLFVFLSSWVWVSWFRRGLPWGWFRKSLLYLVLVMAVLTGAKYIQTHVIRDAVIIVSDAEVRYGPSLNDQIAFRLGEGLKVYVLDRREAWSRILLLNGEGGWIQNVDVGEVRSR
jgi:tetratricopeptide (TPR) repeat protein